MGCDRIIENGKVVGFVCSRGRGSRPKACQVCGKASTVLCDGPPPPKTRKKTCDAPLCAAHAAHVGEDRDLCPVHAREAEAAARGEVHLRTATLHVWTARKSVVDPDLLDITRAGVDTLQRQGLPAPGAAWAPSWSILTPALAARERARQLRDLDARESGCGWAAEAEKIERAAWVAYRPAFVAEMLVSSRAPIPAGWETAVREARGRRGVEPRVDDWIALLARPRVVLACVCVVPECHRFLVAAILKKLGAGVGGELVPTKAPSPQLSLLEVPRAR